MHAAFVSLLRTSPACHDLLSRLRTVPRLAVILHHEHKSSADTQASSGFRCFSNLFFTPRSASIADYFLFLYGQNLSSLVLSVEVSIPLNMLDSLFSLFCFQFQLIGTPALSPARTAAGFPPLIQVSFYLFRVRLRATFHVNVVHPTLFLRVGGAFPAGSVRIPGILFPGLCSVPV